MELESWTRGCHAAQIFLVFDRGFLRDRYFCSELVMECCCAAGLHDPATARPICTYPRELFLGTSRNWYLNQHLDLQEGWCPPARWLEFACK